MWLCYDGVSIPRLHLHEVPFNEHLCQFTLRCVNCLHSRHFQLQWVLDYPHPEEIIRTPRKLSAPQEKDIAVTGVFATGESKAAV